MNVGSIATVIASVLVATFLSCWLVASAVAALPAGARNPVLNHQILVRFIPRWTFFAPIPGVHDFHLVWRTVGDADDEIGPWLEIQDMVPARRGTNLIWNPDKRYRKAMIDLAIQLVREANFCKDVGVEKVSMTLPYLLLAWRVSSAASDFRLVTFFQFAIVTDSLASPDARPVFVSQIHAV